MLLVVLCLTCHGSWPSSEIFDEPQATKGDCMHQSSGFCFSKLFSITNHSFILKLMLR